MRPYAIGTPIERQGILSATRHLVDLARASVAREEAMKGAARMLEAEPEALVHRMVLHFQHLFEVRSCVKLPAPLPCPLVTTPLLRSRS